MDEYRSRRQDQSVGEEIANAVTHGLGALLAVAGLVVLVVFASLRGTALDIVSLAIYGSTLVLLYSASTLYHAVRGPRTKAILNILDHAAIFLLIAGTYTPFTLVSIGGVVGWTLFVIVWTLAVAGVLFKVFHRTHGDRVSLPLYLAMGWLMIVATGELWGSVGAGGTLWLLVGGLAYTTGTVFYLWERMPFNHTVWHLFVLAGSACHFTAVTLYVLPGA
ncbi:MAG: hemolysin III family protein [Alphaproteobacteria bacterium]